MELLETRQLLSLSPALPGEMIERAERIELVADESLHMPAGRALVSDDPAARTARPVPLHEVGEKPHDEFFSIQPVVIVSVPSRRPDAPAWGAESWAGHDLLLSRLPGLEGEAQEHPPQASGSSLDFAMSFFPGKSLVIEVSHLAVGLAPSFPAQPVAATAAVATAPSEEGREAGRLVPDSPVPAPAGMTTPQSHGSDRSLLSFNVNLKSLTPSSTVGREVGSIVVDSLGTMGPSSRSQVAAQFDAPDVTRTNGLGWQVPNVERPLLPNADAVRTEPSADRISPRTEDGFIDLQTIKSRETASILVPGDGPSRSAAGERRADEQDAHTALASDLSWRLLTLYRQDSDADQDGDHFDGESPSEGLASSDLALSVEVMRVLRLELPDDFEDGGMVVIEAPGICAFRAANSADGTLAASSSPTESLRTAKEVSGAMGWHAQSHSDGSGVRQPRPSLRLRDVPHRQHPTDISFAVPNAAGNGVEMDAVCGRMQAFEVSGANAVGAPPAADRRAANDPADSPAVDTTYSSTPSAASAVNDPQATGPNRAAVLPLLLALFPQFLAGRRRRKAASTPEMVAALTSSRPNVSGFLRWLLPPW